jgi:hypothetical protein
MGGKKQKIFKNQFVTEGEFVKILLPDETFALIDKKNEKYVANYNWYYFKNRYCDKGVIAMDKGQVICLHNLLAPYKKVEHINKNRRDCRSVNMRQFSYPQLKKNHRKDHPGKSRFTKIRERTNHFLIVKRFKSEKGSTKEVKFYFFFNTTKRSRCLYSCKEEASKAAQDKLNEVLSWKRGDVEKEYNERKSKKFIMADIISDWDLWDGHYVSRPEFVEMGIKSQKSY